MKVRVGGQMNPRVLKLHEVLKADQTVANSALDSADPVFRRHRREVFKTEGVAGGPVWAPLTPRYKKWKDRFFGAVTAKHQKAQRDWRKLPKVYRTGKPPRMAAENKILQLTGKMKTAMTARSYAESYYRFSRAFIRRGGQIMSLMMGIIGIDYAVYHQEGTPRMKRRPLLQSTPAQDREILEAVRKGFMPHIERRFRILAAWRALRRGRG